MAEMDTYKRVVQTIHPSPERLQRYMELVFDGIRLQGRRVLDVGGGSGLFSFYAAAQGGEVVCVDPYAEGADGRLPRLFERFAQAFDGAVAVQLDRRRFQDLSVGSHFDVVILHNSVNHLDEAACAVAHRDRAAQDRYRSIFTKIYDITAPGGAVIVADCARHNLFGLFGVRNPFAPDIDWEIHQQPRTWLRLLQEVGFVRHHLSWDAPSRLGRAGQVLLGNAAGAFLTNSHFILKVRRPSPESAP